MEDVDAPYPGLITADRDCQACGLESADVCIKFCADDFGGRGGSEGALKRTEALTSFDANGGEAEISKVGEVAQPLVAYGGVSIGVSDEEGHGPLVEQRTRWTIGQAGREDGSGWEEGSGGEHEG